MIGATGAVPVMDGEFFCEGKVGLTKKSVGGGNLLIMGADWDKTMRATEAAVSAIDGVADAIACRSRRHRALGLKGRFEIQGHERVDQ